MNDSNNELERQLEQQSTLVDCVKTLYINNNVDEAIDELLEIIAGYYGADRGYIFEYSYNMQRVHNTYEWCAEGISSEKDMLADIDASVIGRWQDIFEEKGEFYINSLSGELDESSAEYQLLSVQGIESLMAAPLYDHSQLIGFIGVDNPKKNTDQLILMQMVAAFVVNDMQKRETLEQRILRAIGSSYVSINLIDLVNDTQQIINRDPLATKFLNHIHNATKQMVRITKELTSPEYLDIMLEFTDLTTLKERMSDTNVISSEFLASDGHWCRISFVASMRSEDGSLVEAILTMIFIDSQKKKELEYQSALKKALENQKEIYAEMLHLQSWGVIAARTDNGKVVLMNDAAQELFGVHENGISLTDIIRPAFGDDYEIIRSRLDEIRYRHGSCSFEFTICNNDKKLYFKAVARNVTLAGGDDILIITMADITDKKLLENRLLELSETDALTRIRNRGSGEQRTELLISKGTKGMFCLMDVDKFKTINDTFGHVVGDKALIAIADCLSSTFRSDDVVMRLGGDEFAVFAVGVESHEQGRDLIMRLISHVEQIHIPEMGEKKITISLGAVLCHDSSVQFDKLYLMADEAMYDCKKIPGNQFDFYRE